MPDKSVEKGRKRCLVAKMWRYQNHFSVERIKSKKKASATVYVLCVCVFISTTTRLDALLLHMSVSYVWMRIPLKVRTPHPKTGGREGGAGPKKRKIGGRTDGPRGVLNIKADAETREREKTIEALLLLLLPLIFFYSPPSLHVEILLSAIFPVPFRLRSSPARCRRCRRHRVGLLFPSASTHTDVVAEENLDWVSKLSPELLTAAGSLHTEKKERPNVCTHTHTR